MNSKVKLEPRLLETEKSDISMHSEGRPEGNGPADNFFSFSQSFANVQQAGDKALQQRSNSMSRIKALQDEVRSYKSRSVLWEKAKSEIINLNKYLKMSSITLGCGDSAIMKEFFDVVQENLEAKEGKNKDDRNKLADSKRREAELFEKLVEANKKKYELEQKVVQYEHQITKLSDINQSMREKSRAQSTERSSKIREFHEQTLMTIHQKDSELYTLQERNNQLKLDIARLEQKVQTLNSQLHSRDHDLADLKESNEELYAQLHASKLEIKHLKQAEQETEATFLSIKQEISKIVEENATLRREVASLKAVMEEAKVLNEEFINETQASLFEEESRRQARIDELLRKEEEVLKKKLSNSIKFSSMRKKPRRITQRIPSEVLLLPSEQLLI